MNAMQQRFVKEYLTDQNATQAAIRAGYSEKAARTQGQRLLTIVDIAKAIDAGKSKKVAALGTAVIAENPAPQYPNAEYTELVKAKEREVNEEAIKFAAGAMLSSEASWPDGVKGTACMALNYPAEMGSKMNRLIVAKMAERLPDKLSTNAVIDAIGPRDGVEVLLATQMAAIHEATISNAIRLHKAETLDDLKVHESAVNKLTRTFASQVEALRKHRTRGVQTVKHVHVNEGGQAIVADTVSTTHVTQGEG